MGFMCFDRMAKPIDELLYFRVAKSMFRETSRPSFEYVEDPIFTIHVLG